MYSAVSAVGEKRFGRWVRVEGIFSHARMKTADVRSGTRGHSQMMTGELLLPQRCGNGSRFGSVVGSYWRYHHHVLALARSDGGKNNRKHFSLTRLNPTTYDGRIAQTRTCERVHWNLRYSDCYAPEETRGANLRHFFLACYRYFISYHLVQ